MSLIKSQYAHSDGHYINKLSEAFFNGSIDKLTKGTLLPSKPDGRKKAEERRARRDAKRALNARRAEAGKNKDQWYPWDA